MPDAPTRVALDPDRHGRRAAWIALVITLLVTAGFHAQKAADSRGAFIRWRHQVHDFWRGENIWDKYLYPNPPILPLAMSPLMALPELPGAMTWFALKAGLACLSIWLCFRMTRDGRWPLPSWTQFPVMLLSIRPILSDLHHANNNLVILGLIVGSLYAWREGFDVLAGLLLALAIAFKVTPALFVPYFMYKRSWRTVGAACLGVGIFLLIVPSLVLGPQSNGQYLAMWWHRILSPYFERGITSVQEVNQSMVGVLTRLLTESRLADDHGNSGVQVQLNLLALDPRYVGWLVKGLSIGLVGLLAVFCRTKADRRDSRWLGEFALVALTMLFVSERSWKHHYVTLLLPVTYLVHRMTVAPASRRVRWTLGASLLASTLLMATTSSDLSGVFTRRIDGKEVPGHDIAQFYGMFFWSGVVLYAATAWRLVAEGRRDVKGRVIPAPHLAVDARSLVPSPLEGEG